MKKKVLIIVTIIIVLLVIIGSVIGLILYNNSKEESVNLKDLTKNYTLTNYKINNVSIKNVDNKTKIEFYVTNTSDETLSNDTIYIQVSRSILDEKVEEREKKSLLAIKDNHRKIILTMDQVSNKQIDGIEVINIIDFLMQS